MPGDCTVTHSERTTHLGLRGDLKLPCLLIPFQPHPILFAAHRTVPRSAILHRASSNLQSERMCMRDGTCWENKLAWLGYLFITFTFSGTDGPLNPQFRINRDVFFFFLLCHWTIFSISPAGRITMRSKTTTPGACPAPLLPVFFEVLYIWISRFTAPPQHVHFQLPVSIYKLFLSTFSTKRNKTEGGQPCCMWGANTAQNIVHELLLISIPQCYRQTIPSIRSGRGRGVNRRRNALGRKYCPAMTQK